SRDFDDQGRRIPCPRVGEITCGEHIDLEPELFEKYLADGERVAPRHAVVLQDGTKAWDLSLIFDLKDLDRALEASAHAEVDRQGAKGTGSPGSTNLEPSVERWLALAARRDQRGRSEFEEALASTTDLADVRSGLEAIGKRGDAGSIVALHLASSRLLRESS